ncbi:MAG: DUF6114 domain-containing protein [Nitrososphaeraceae archaeon]
MEKVSRNSDRNPAIPSSSILSIIAGSLIIIGGFLIPLTMMLGMSGHYGMKMSRFGTGVMTRGSCGIIRGGCGMMMIIPFQPLTWWTATAVIPVFSIVTGVILIIGGYSIYKSPESEGKWGIPILITSIVSLFGMGGFLIGSILGIIGGITALTRR